MGIPVSGKNVFPSNIQGLPTWYEIRVNADGYTARSPDFQLVVAMNPQSYERDIEEVVSGGWVLYDNTRELPVELRRDDVTFLGVPLAQIHRIATEAVHAGGLTGYSRGHFGHSIGLDDFGEEPPFFAPGETAALEPGHADQSLNARLQRFAGLLKGAARLVRLNEVAELGRKIEELLAPYARTRRPMPTPRR